MNKKIITRSFAILISLNAVSSYASLSSSALLAFDAGAQICDETSLICTMQGSYFAVDSNDDGSLSVFESIGISPGTDGGLLIGESQLASNSHTGSPDGSEVAPFDAPWSFLANTGMHQSTSPVNVYSDDGSGNVLLDFSGWGAVWNGLTIGLGGDSLNFATETGLATVTCGADCSVGDVFTLDYAAHVAADDPNNFGGVFWGIHLEGKVSAVPVPAAIWLFSSGLLGLFGFMRRRNSV